MICLLEFNRALLQVTGHLIEGCRQRANFISAGDVGTLRQITACDGLRCSSPMNITG